MGDHSSNFFVLKKCNGKLDCLISVWDVHKIGEAKPEHNRTLSAQKVFNGTELKCTRVKSCKHWYKLLTCTGLVFFCYLK